MQEKILRAIVEPADLPDSWQVLPNRALFDERNIKGQEDEELLSVSLNYGVLRQADIKDRKDTSSSDKSKYKLVLPGDLVYNKMRMWQGAVGISKYRGIVSPAYVVLSPRIELHQEYYIYLFKTRFYINEFNRFSYGLCDDMNSLRYSDFKLIYSIFPPFNDQKFIVDFLDHETAKIDSIIAILNSVTPSTNKSYIDSVLKTLSKLFEAINFTGLLNNIADRQNGHFMSNNDSGLASYESPDFVNKVLLCKDVLVEFRNSLVHHAVLGNMEI